jgi:hypothetical protein
MQRVFSNAEFEGRLHAEGLAIKGDINRMVRRECEFSCTQNIQLWVSQLNLSCHIDEKAGTP